MAITYRTPTRALLAPPGDPAEVESQIREYAGALYNALQVVRLAAGDRPGLAKALDLADRLHSQD